MQQNICRAPCKALSKMFSPYFEYSTRARKPSIKFLGTRHPQPKFDPSATSSTAAAAVLSNNKTSPASANKVAIEFTKLPAKFRRKLISEEEIQMINSGGFRN